MPIAFGSAHTATGVSGTTLAVTGITGGTDQAYVLCVSDRSNVSADSVAGGGMIWTKQKQQCGARSQTGIALFTAFGTPNADPYTATITFASAILAAAAGVLRYTGHTGTFENSVGSNTLGQNGACSGGTDNTALTIDIAASSADNSMIVVGANPRLSALTAEDVDYSKRVDNINAGTGGNQVKLYVHERLLAVAAADTCAHTIGTARDWCMNAIVLKAAAAKRGTWSIHEGGLLTGGADAGGDRRLMQGGLHEADFDLLAA